MLKNARIQHVSPAHAAVNANFAFATHSTVSRTAVAAFFAHTACSRPVHAAV